MNKGFYFLVLIGFLFLSSCDLRKDKRIVALQPFEGFDTKLCDSLKSAIERYYGFRVYILPSRILPLNAFVTIKSPRYRADSIIYFLKEIKADSIDYIMGLTDKDISFSKTDEEGNIMEPAWKYKDFGIFGLGFRPGVSCVVSSFRLNSEHKEFFSRIKKVSLHELGHNLGLEHCKSVHCFMRSAAEKIQTVDQVKLELCSSCKEKI